MFKKEIKKLKRVKGKRLRREMRETSKTCRPLHFWMPKFEFSSLKKTSNLVINVNLIMNLILKSQFQVSLLNFGFEFKFLFTMIKVSVVFNVKMTQFDFNSNYWDKNSDLIVWCISNYEKKIINTEKEKYNKSEREIKFIAR